MAFIFWVDQPELQVCVLHLIILDFTHSSYFENKCCRTSIGSPGEFQSEAQKAQKTHLHQDNIRSIWML